MKHIVQLSGGKDSTAMLLMMLERNMPVDEIIFCDTGMEFPELYQHLEAVEAYMHRTALNIICAINQRTRKRKRTADEVMAGRECSVGGVQVVSK